MAILLIGPAIMPLQILFFAQNLTVKQPHGCPEINQYDPIWEYQEFTNQDHGKRDIDRIAAKRKSAVHDELVGMIGVYDLWRFGESAHVCVTRREKAVRMRKGRSLLQRGEQDCRRIVEFAIEKMSDAQSDAERAEAITRAQA